MSMNKKNYSLLELLLITLLFEPTLFVKYSKINWLFIIGACISFAYIFLKVFRNEKFSIFTIEIIILRVLYIFTTVINKGDILKVGYQSIIIVSLCLYAEFFYRKERIGDFIEILTTICRWYLLINIVTYICFPDGLYSEEKYIYFLGYRTRFTEFIFLMIPLSIFQYSQMKNKKYLFIDIVIIYLTISLPKISTAIIGCIVLILTYLIIIKIKKFNFKILLYVAILLNMLIIVFRVQNAFAFFIEDILGKSTDLTYRTVIWDYSYKYIFDKECLLGHGYPDNGNFIFWADRMWQAHNQILQLLYEIGIFGTILFFNICYKVQKNSNFIYLKDKRILIFVLSLFSFYIMMITEIYGYYLPFYALLYVIYFFDFSLLNNNERK